MTLEYRMLRAGDGAVLDRVAADVLDDAIQPALAREFVDDERHRLAAAIDDGIVVGFASAVHYVHPDKPPELWINEVGVAPTHLRRGLAQTLSSGWLYRRDAAFQAAPAQPCGFSTRCVEPG